MFDDQEDCIEGYAKFRSVVVAERGTLRQVRLNRVRKARRRWRLAMEKAAAFIVRQEENTELCVFIGAFVGAFRSKKEENDAGQKALGEVLAKAFDIGDLVLIPGVHSLRNRQIAGVVVLGFPCHAGFTEAVEARLLREIGSSRQESCILFDCFFGRVDVKPKKPTLNP